jgi:hydrogenase maturation protease
VIELTADDLSNNGVRPLSSHGMGMREVIGLARTLAPDRVSPSIHVVAVTIARPERFGHGLSPAVAEAVGRAADTVLRLVNT